MEAQTRFVATAIHFERQPCNSLQGRHRPMAVVTHAHLVPQARQVV
jgi:hypothetical protein